MRRCAAGRPSGWSSRSFPAIVPLRAAEYLRQQLLRVLRLHPQPPADLDDAASFEIAHPKNLLVARLQSLQRLARRELVGKAVEDSRGRRIGALERLVVVERLDEPAVLPPVIAAGVADGAEHPGMDIQHLVRPSQIAEKHLMGQRFGVALGDAELPDRHRDQKVEMFGVELFEKSVVAKRRFIGRSHSWKFSRTLARTGEDRWKFVQHPL